MGLAGVVCGCGGEGGTEDEQAVSMRPQPLALSHLGAAQPQLASRQRQRQQAVQLSNHLWQGRGVARGAPQSGEGRPAGMLAPLSPHLAAASLITSLQAAMAGAWSARRRVSWLAMLLSMSCGGGSSSASAVEQV